MKIEKIPLDKSKTISWRDGTSNELYISPKEAQFSQRNFDYRISIATVEKTPSIFSEINGFERCLTVLEGIQHLSFNGEPSQTIQKNQFVFFSGDAQTNCEGLSTNFNIIYRPALNVKIHSNCSEIECLENTDYIIYSLHSFTILIGNETIEMNNSHFFLLQNSTKTERLRIVSENLENIFILEISLF